MWCGASWGVVVSRSRREREAGGPNLKDHRHRHEGRNLEGFGEPDHSQNCTLDRRESEDETREAMAPTRPGSIAGMVAERVLLLSRLSLCGCCLRGMCMDERCSDCCVFKSGALLSSASPGKSRANERWESIHEAVPLSLRRGKETAGCS